MLRRTGHWWSRKRLWVYSNQSAEQVAPRPHNLTIALALFSPVLAVVATIVSVLSLRTSQDSLEIGQRAYLHVSNGSYHIKYGKTEKDGRRIDVIVLSGDIKNDGRTPATLTSQDIGYYSPDNWSFWPANGLVESDMNQIGPFVHKHEELRSGGLEIALGDTFHWSSERRFIVTGDIQNTKDSRPIVPNAICTITYSDVFGKSHELTFKATFVGELPKDSLHRKLAPAGPPKVVVRVIPDR